jgi:hypothetical protein
MMTLTLKIIMGDIIAAFVGVFIWLEIRDVKKKNEWDKLARITHYLKEEK